MEHQEGITPAELDIDHYRRLDPLLTATACHSILNGSRTMAVEVG